MSFAASIVRLLVLIASAATAAIKWFHDRNMVEHGKSLQKLDDMKGRIDAMRSAQAAREAQRRSNNVEPDSVMRPDKFTRADDPDWGT